MHHEKTNKKNRIPPRAYIRKMSMKNRVMQNNELRRSDPGKLRSRKNKQEKLDPKKEYFVRITMYHA